MRLLESARLTVLGLLALAALSSLPLEPLPDHPRLVLSWWDEVGTASASAAAVRALALAGFGYVVTVAVLVGAADACRCRGLGIAVRRLATPALRRRLGAGTVALSLAVPAPVSAEESPIRLTDRGPAPTPPAGEQIEVSDVGPVEARGASPAHHPLGRRSEVTAGPHPRTWLVQPGDHLWAIAEHVVRAASPDATEADLVAYWLRLIDANHDMVGDNADLIHPGQVIVLPPPG